MKITDREILIWLNSIGVNNSIIEKIINNFKKLTEFWEAEKEEICNLVRLKEEVIEKILKNRNKDNIEKLFNRLDNLRITTITIYDEDYPERLRYIHGRPNVLYTKGKITEEDNLALGIV